MKHWSVRRFAASMPAGACMLLAAMPALSAPVPVTVDPDKGFRFEAGGSWLQIGVLGQFDIVNFKDDRQDISDASDFRRLRPNIAGRFLDDWQFRASYELSGDPGVIDAYVTYLALQPVTITVGNFLQPYSMESFSSDRTNSFMERALPFAFSMSRAPGAMVAISKPDWTAAAGVFGEALATEDTGDEGRGVAARGTWSPWHENGRVLHLGLSGFLRKPSQDSSSDTDQPPFDTVRFRARPEADLAPRLVDTGEIPGDVRSWSGITPEFGAGWGPTSLQAEFTSVRVQRQTGSTLEFGGWYVQGTWTITGEPREYKSERAVFDGPGLASAFKHGGGWGAWELALRLSDLDLSDEDIDGGRQRDATIGINAFLNQFVRVTANVVKVLEVKGGPQAGDTPTVFGLRFQLGI